MSNKELILKFYDEVFNNWDLSNLDEYMLDSYKQHNPTVLEGKEGFLKFAEKFLALKPKIEIHQVISDGDLVVVFFKCTLGANGMENKVFDMYRIEDGKLAEHWDCVQHDVGGIESVNGNSQF